MEKVTIMDLAAQMNPSALAKTIRTHPRRMRCPRCNDDLTKAALKAVLYVYDPCDCNEAAYTHLIEQLWHRTCFAKVAHENADQPKQRE